MQQDRQDMYKAILRRVFAVVKQKVLYVLSVCL